MTNIPEPVKGFRDITGYEAKVREWITEILIRNFRICGFEPAETPVIEQAEFVKGNNFQDEAVSDVFKLKDKGERELALRYEFTFQLKRLANNKKLPYKRYQIGSVFRDEPISANRYRQFTQCDVDVVGSSVKDEADVLALATKIFNELGIKTKIIINNRKLLNEIMESEKIKSSDKQQVITEIDKLDKLPQKQVLANLKKYKAEKLLEIFNNPEEFFKKYKFYSEIEDLKKYCGYYGISVEFSPSLARGLSYYNSSIFEVKSNEMKETISAGGSYLVNGIQSTGISFGLDRLSQLAKMKHLETGVVIISLGQDEKAISLVETLRSKAILSEIWTGKGLSRALEYANSYNMPYVIFIGDEEVKKNKVKLKNMITGEEELIDEEKLVHELQIKKIN